MPGLPIPMARIGFLGHDDSVSKELKLGGVLIHTPPYEFIGAKI